MPAERRGAARLDGGHDAALGLREPAALRRAERIAVAAENIRHLQDGAHAPGSVWRDDLNREPIKRAGCARDEIRRNLSVARRRSQIAMSEQSLDDANIDPAFQQMSGEGMPKGMDRAGLPIRARRLAARHAAWIAQMVTGPLGSRPGNNHSPGCTRFQ